MSLKSSSFVLGAALAALSAGYLLSVVLQDAVDQDFEAVNEKALEDARKYFSPIQGSILSPTRKIAVPDLTKDNGEAFTLDDLTGKWHLLFFGYTHCPDICPTTMGTLAQAKKISKVNNHIFPDVIFISVDPERDKVELLGDYVRYFDKDFIGVTGSEDMIKALTLQVSVVYMKMAEQKPQKKSVKHAKKDAGKDKVANKDAESSGYLVDHSSALLLVNPEGRLVAFLNPPHSPDVIIDSFQSVVNQSNMPSF